MLVLSMALLFHAAPYSFAAGALLQNRYDRLTDSGASMPASHVIGFTMTDLATPVGSILIEFCSNSPIVGETCTPPGGFDISAVSLGSQVGETGFSIGAVTTNTIVLSRPAALPIGAQSEYRLNNIINPNTPGSHYARIQTYTSTDATGASIDYGGVVFAIHGGLSLSIEVPPYLIFCASVTISGFDCGTANSYFIDLGEFAPNKVTTASSEFQVATNAPSGYSVTVSGTTLTSGNNTISPLFPSGASTPGTPQFGINLRNNSDPDMGSDPIGYGAGVISGGYNVPNQFRFQNGDTMVTASTTSDFEKFTVSYIANVNSGTPAGIYATTLTYICLANF